MFEVVCNDNKYNQEECWRCKSDKLVIQETYCKHGLTYELSSVEILCLECNFKKIRTYISAFLDDSVERISVFVRDDRGKL